MFRTGGTVAVSVGALLTAGSMNLAVLSEGPSGPGHLVLRAASGTTTSSQPAHHTARLAVAEQTTSTTAAQRAKKLRRAAPANTTTTASSTTTEAPHGSTTTTQPPTTTTTSPPPKKPDGQTFTYAVRDAGHVNVQWVNKGHTITATAFPNDGFTLPHVTKHGPDVTLRFSNNTELVVWHAWVENHHIHCWTKTYKLPG